MESQAQVVHSSVPDDVMLRLREKNRLVPQIAAAREKTPKGYTELHIHTATQWRAVVGILIEGRARAAISKKRKVNHKAEE